MSNIFSNSQKHKNSCEYDISYPHAIIIILKLILKMLYFCHKNIPQGAKPVQSQKNNVTKKLFPFLSNIIFLNLNIFFAGTRIHLYGNGILLHSNNGKEANNPQIWLPAIKSLQTSSKYPTNKFKF